jgi:Holliday junction resolvase
MASGIFERELKRILQGDEATLQGVTRSCSPNEKSSYFKIVDRPFIVIRSAGSLGIDLVAIRGDVSFPIEVKSSIFSTIRLSSKRLQEQSKELLRLSQRSKLIPVYAYRLKNVRGDSWRIFTVEVSKVRGILSSVYRRLPKVDRTKANNIVLRWTNGMPLNKFIDYLDFCKDRPDPSTLFSLSEDDVSADSDE